MVAPGWGLWRVPFPESYAVKVLLNEAVLDDHGAAVLGLSYVVNVGFEAWSTPKCWQPSSFRVVPS